MYFSPFLLLYFVFNYDIIDTVVLKNPMTILNRFNHRYNGFLYFGYSHSPSLIWNKWLSVNGRFWKTVWMVRTNVLTQLIQIRWSLFWGCTPSLSLHCSPWLFFRRFIKMRQIMPLFIMLVFYWLSSLWNVSLMNREVGFGTERGRHERNFCWVRKSGVHFSFVGGWEK